MREALFDFFTTETVTLALSNNVQFLQFSPYVGGLSVSPPRSLLPLQSISCHFIFISQRDCEGLTEKFSQANADILQCTFRHHCSMSVNSFTGDAPTFTAVPTEGELFAFQPVMKCCYILFCITFWSRYKYKQNILLASQHVRLQRTFLFPKWPK